MGSSEATGAVQIFQRGEKAAADVLGRINVPVERLLLGSCEAGNHTQMQHVSTLSIEQQQKDTSRFLSWFFLSVLMNCSLCCAFLIRRVVLALQIRSYLI